MIEPKTLPGFMELLPQDQILFNKIKDTIQKNYESFGFVPLDTPVLESSDVLLAKAGGETEKQIYNFKKGDNSLCMRFDLTVPLAKYVAQNYSSLNFPFARYQIGKVYRGERPQKGRFREFYQCDIDVIGKNSLSLYYDAEIPSVMYKIFKELDIGKFTIFVSNRKILLGLIDYLGLKSIDIEILRLIDKFAKIGEENFVSTLKIDYKLNDEIVDSLLKFIKISGTVKEQIATLYSLNIENETFLDGVKELEEVTNYMSLFGIEEGYFNINLSIARGLDYYTGTVYETFIEGYESLGSVCSGGRFDNLAEYYTNEKLPGVGMSIGLTRLFYQLKEYNLLKEEKGSVVKAVILPMGETKAECIKLSNILRENGINNTVYFEDKKFKNKILYATQSNADYAIIIGEDEVANNNYTIKNLKEFAQQQLSLNEIIELLKNDWHKHLFVIWYFTGRYGGCSVVG